MFQDPGPPPAPALTVEVQSAGRLRLVGELDRATRNLVDAVMAEMTVSELLIDVEQLRFADAAGLAVLAAQDTRRRAEGGRVVLVGASLFLRQTLRAAGLSQLLPCHQESAEGETWRTLAACREAPTRLFFDQRDSREHTAKELCFRCPVAGPCLAYALRTRQRSGVWGGLTANERDQLMRTPAPRDSEERSAH